MTQILGKQRRRERKREEGKKELQNIETEKEKIYKMVIETKEQQNNQC